MAGAIWRPFCGVDSVWRCWICADDCNSPIPLPTPPIHHRWYTPPTLYYNDDNDDVDKDDHDNVDDDND